MNHNKPDIFVLDKKNKEIFIVEVGITNQDLLTIVENEKQIIPYVMTWDGVVTTYHKKYIKELGIQLYLETYIQLVVLKKTLESISIERRRGHDQGDAGEVERTVEKLVELNYKYMEGKTMDPINDNQGKILDPEYSQVTLNVR
ncbi:hypothetical protein NAPIS_ORF02758 [Vairimorpha apis BRL 01]|uniref:Uncharacterized protein n=1 Tax=Vairimorpha apis BRL 01 TaxID=1037528 RepID=T0L5A0_9MICR|nr:hypothetical protein NAPIS_ORF02758 [Vairimorpha apis BRL 01]